MRYIFLNLFSMINFDFSIISTSSVDEIQYHENYTDTFVYNNSISCLDDHLNPHITQNSEAYGYNKMNDEIPLSTPYTYSDMLTPLDEENTDIDRNNKKSTTLLALEAEKTKSTEKINNFLEKNEGNADMVCEVRYTLYLIENLQSDSNRDLSTNPSLSFTSDFCNSFNHPKTYYGDYEFEQARTTIFDFNCLISNLSDKVRYLDSFLMNQETISNISKYIESIERKEAEYIAMFPERYYDFRQIWLRKIEKDLKNDTSIITQLFPEFYGLKIFILKNKDNLPNMNNYHVSSLLLLKYLFSNKYISNIKNEFETYKQKMQKEEYYLYKYLCEKKIVFEIFNLFIIKMVSNMNVRNIFLIINSTERIILLKKTERRQPTTFYNINFIRSVIFLLEENVIKDLIEIYSLILHNVVLYGLYRLNSKDRFKVIKLNEFISLENLFKILSLHLKILEFNLKNDIIAKKQMNKNESDFIINLKRVLNKLLNIYTEINKKEISFKLRLKIFFEKLYIFDVILKIKDMNDRLMSILLGDFQLYSSPYRKYLSKIFEQFDLILIDSY